jgi:hypothetical protein
MTLSSTGTAHPLSEMGDEREGGRVVPETADVLERRLFRSVFTT